MGKKHFFLYDFLIPLAGIVLIGHWFSDRFDSVLFRKVDAIRAFGLGEWFGHSALRATLWEYSWAIFAVAPALAWMVWVRINLEYDWIERRRKLDRPIYKFFAGFFRWIEDGGEMQRQRQAFEFRLAQAHDHIHRLDAELAAYKAQEAAEAEWPDDVMPPARQG